MKFLPFFSYLFHPLFAPFYTVLFFFYVDENYLSTQEKMLVLAQVLIMLVLIPVLFFLMLRMLGKVDSFMVSEVSQRRLPLLLQIVLIVLLLRQAAAPDRLPELFCFFTGAAVTGVSALISAFAKFKVSLHMAAMAAMTAFVFALGLHNQINLSGAVSFLLISTGLVGASRLQMKAHTLGELTLGLAAGLIPQAALWNLWL